MKIRNQRDYYYKNFNTLWNLFYPMKKREVVFMNRVENWKCIRGIGIKTMQNLEYYFRTYSSIITQDENIYISLAQYKTIPEFTVKLKERSKFTSEWFKNNFSDIFAYDILLDFDYNKEYTRQSYYNELKTIYDILLNFGIKFYMIFSGNNYQIVIDSIVHDEKFENTENQTIKNWIYRIKEEFDFKHLDLKGAGVSNKIMKCPYSLVENRIVLPIKKFNLMEKSKYEIENINKIFDLKNRGLMYNNYDVIYQKDRFKTFIEKYKLNKPNEIKKEQLINNNKPFELNEELDFSDLDEYMSDIYD